MEKVGELIDEIYDNSQSFVRSEIKAAKLEVYERVTNLISSGISAGIIITMTMLALLFVNFGLAYWIGDLIESRSLGYVIVGGFYFIALIFYLALRNRVGANLVKNAVLKKVSKDYEDFDILLEDQEKVQVEIGENMHVMQTNVGKIKDMVVGSRNKEKVTEESRSVVTSAVDFVFQNVIFRNGGLVKQTLLPVVANTLLTSKLFHESKLKSLIENFKSKLLKRFNGKSSK